MAKKEMTEKNKSYGKRYSLWGMKLFLGIQIITVSNCTVSIKSH